MKIYTTSRDDYLKALLVLQKKMGNVRSIDIVRYLGVTRPSVSRAVSNLIDGGFIYMDNDFSLNFTDKGRKIAENTLERYSFFANKLIELGVYKTTAQEDACKLEHAISDESFEILKMKTNV